MTDQMKPEDRALIERLFGPQWLSTGQGNITPGGLALLLDAARQEGRCSPSEGGEPRRKLLDTEDLADKATFDHPDTYLNALLTYTRDLYGALVKAGWKPKEIADCFQHIERAARGLHAKAIPTRDEAALPEPVETVERYGDAIDAAQRMHDWVNAIAEADKGKYASREVRSYTFNEDDGGAYLYFRNNRVAAGGFMVRDLHNFTVSMKVFEASRLPAEGEG